MADDELADLRQKRMEQIQKQQMDSQMAAAQQEQAQQEKHDRLMQASMTEEEIARASRGIGDDLLRVDGSRDRQAELDLLVLQGVAANQGAGRLFQGLEGPFQDQGGPFRREEAGIEGQEHHGGQGRAPHRKDVGKGI